MQEVKLYNSIMKNLLFLLICLVFVISGFWMVSTSTNNINFIIGIISILFFGLGLIMFPKQILDRKPRIIINDEGIYDRTLKVGIIEWRDINDAYLQSISGSEFISLVLTDNNKYLQRTTKTFAKIASYNEILGFETLNVNLSGVNKSGKEVLKIINEELRNALRENQIEAEFNRKSPRMDEDDQRTKR